MKFGSAVAALTGLAIATGAALAQAGGGTLPAAPQAPAAQQAPAGAGSKAAAPAGGQTGGQTNGQAAPLKLYSLNSETQADPFPPVNPKFFTAEAPSVATVEGYLKTMLGFDPNRIWRVVAIQKTAAPGVSKVVVLVTQKGNANAKVQTAVFFVMPDGKHLIAGDAMTPFGAEPFAPVRAELQARADGPATGSASKDLMIVEFSDLQCPHCKEAEPTMKKLEKDFPKARFVYQAFPLQEVHPYAFEAAAYGTCIAEKSAQAYFSYADQVYANQGALVPETAEQTLKDAATKAGMDPAAIAQCAAGEQARAKVNASIALGQEIGIDQTPMLVVNGRLLAFTSIPYETLRQLIAYQAQMDGVSAAAAGAGGIDLKPR